ncbi:MAG: hypothetical protein JWN14_3885 [Chthonomonadales bacterium]|nr:hypothetical protein [Chthonomonadales bacterium]
MDFIERLFHISLDIDGGNGMLEGLLILMIVGTLVTFAGISWHRRQKARLLPASPPSPLSPRDRMQYDSGDLSE